MRPKLISVSVGVAIPKLGIWSASPDRSRRDGSRRDQIGEAAIVPPPRNGRTDRPRCGS
jgi:hypothetical protein